MRKIFLSIALFWGALLIGASVFAAGGGGGGGGGSACTEDQWSCTEWGACSPDGRQTRSCRLSYDCPTANTPSPATEQACVPSAPSKPAPSAGACDRDTWTCGDWQACDAYGNQERECKLTRDCPMASTPSPAASQRCDRLQCGDLQTLDARVRCRVNLAPAGIDRELELQYLPEECRAETDPSVRAACIARYRAIVPCYDGPVGEGRFACGRRALGLGSPVPELVRECQAKPEAERAACLQTLREKVHSMVKFRLYDLEERAEDLFDKGVGSDRIGEFVSFIESQKLKFNQAKTKDERVAIVLAVRERWQLFAAGAASLITP